MFSNSFSQWIIFFYIYCVFGWLIESTIVSVESKKFVNRGFLRGPFLPLYGFGALSVLLLTIPIKNNVLLVYVLGMTGTTILEYITGCLMEMFLKTKYWDYSDEKFNLNGKICLKSSLFWGVLSIFLTCVLHKAVERIVFFIDNDLIIIINIVISVIFAIDLIYAVKTAVDVNKLLENITKIKFEIEKLNSQLISHIDNNDKIVTIKEKILKYKDEIVSHYNRINFFQKDLIKANPSARSVNFNEALTELKNKLREINKK